MSRLLPLLFLLGTTSAFPPSVMGQERPPDSVLALARAEFRVGRYWHGLEGIRRALDGGAPPDREVLLLLAEGEAGWGNWPAVLDLIREPLVEGRLAGPFPWFLLGRGLAGSGDAPGAVDAYTFALEALEGDPDGSPAVDRVDVRIRRTRSRMAAGDVAGAGEDLAAVLLEDESRGRWLALELARGASEEGNPQATLSFLSAVEPTEVRLRGWALPARALLASGDSTGAEAAYWSAIPSLERVSEQGEAWDRVGALRLARADSAGARAAYHQVLQADPGGRFADGAAESLLRLGFDSAGVALRAAEALGRSGRQRDALRAYEAYDGLLGGAVPREVRLAEVRAHLALREPARGLEILDSLEVADGPDASAPALVLRSRALGAAGRTSQARAVQDSLIARYPDRPESVEILFLRADARQDRGDLRGAMAGFEATAALSPSQNLAGQARMRLGQIHLTQGREAEAAEVYQAYLEAFPDGRRWDEAAFWAGRSLMSLGREAEARDVLLRLRSRFALSYYAVQSGALLDLPYEPDIPAPSSRPPLTERTSRGLDRIDALLRSGLEEGAEWEVETLADSIRKIQDPEARRGGLLRLALELNDRGLTREGINLGWEIRRLGGAWDRDLLSVIYPFPYREMVLQEAAEWGLDPFLMAGLMRQESAFWREARSRADARGLMQVLPATGRELARARGPRGFDAEEHLYRPEINTHLGMAFFSDLMRRFGDDLSILLSAYNAGPTRARRWRQYPEAGDLTRFVERIPFSETRGYVKNVLLNREIYAWLYGTPRGPTGTVP